MDALNLVLAAFQTGAGQQAPATLPTLPSRRQVAGVLQMYGLLHGCWDPNVGCCDFPASSLNHRPTLWPISFLFEE